MTPLIGPFYKRIGWYFSDHNGIETGPYDYKTDAAAALDRATKLTKHAYPVSTCKG